MRTYSLYCVQGTAQRNCSRILYGFSVNDIPNLFVRLLRSLAREDLLDLSATAEQARNNRSDASLLNRLMGEIMTTKPSKPVPPRPNTAWVRIPDGTKVKHRHEGHIGFIDGLTEIVTGPNRNPDGKTQYRMNIGAPDRQLVTESDLSILIDDEDLVIMLRQKAPYRRAVTQSLHSVLAPDRFVKLN